MIFKGRYWTNNGTLVQIHDRNRGHIIYSPQVKMVWDDDGSCIMSDGHVSGISGYDLTNVVNPQSLEAGLIVVEGCEECKKERERSLGIVKDAKEHQPFKYDPTPIGGVTNTLCLNGNDTLIESELTPLTDTKLIELSDCTRNGDLVVRMALELQEWRSGKRSIGY